MNRQIRATQVRLVEENGSRIMKLTDALNFAQRQNKDLIAISRDSETPAVKMVYWNEYEQDQERKIKARQRAQPKMKTIQLRGVTADNDLKTKLKQVRQFAEYGWPTKIVITDGTPKNPPKPKPGETLPPSEEEIRAKAMLNKIADLLEGELATDRSLFSKQAFAVFHPVIRKKSSNENKKDNKENDTRNKNEKEQEKSASTENKKDNKEKEFENKNEKIQKGHQQYQVEKKSGIKYSDES